MGMTHHILDFQGDALTGKEDRNLFLVCFFTSVFSAGLGMAKCLQVGPCQTGAGVGLRFGLRKGLDKSLQDRILTKVLKRLS